jgi:hypothetical protein
MAAERQTHSAVPERLVIKRDNAHGQKANGDRREPVVFDASSSKKYYQPQFFSVGR